MRVHLGLLIALLAGVFAGPSTHPVAYKQQAGEFVATRPDAPALLPPGVSIDFKSTIDTLADYSLEHERSSFFGSTFYGVTDYQMRTIHISDKYDIADRRETILHELLHVAYRNVGVQTGDPVSEVELDAQAQQIFKQLYGVK